MIIDAVVALGGLIIPPVYDFVKKKFIKSESDTIESTASSLATTAPERLPEYISSMAGLTEVQIKWFNRDVIGTPSQIIIDLRAAIRPVTIVLCLLCLICSGFDWFTVDTTTRLPMDAWVSSWFGDRLSRS